MREFFPTLRARLTLWYTLVLALVLTVFAGLLYTLVRYQLVRHHDRGLKGDASVVATVLSEEDEREAPSASQQLKLDQISNLVVLRDTGGRAREVYRSPDSMIVIPSRWPDEISLEHGPGWFETLVVDGHLFRVYSEPYRSRAGRRELIRLAASLGDVPVPLASLRIALLVMAPLAVLLSAAGGYWLAGRALGPVDQVTRLAREIGASSLSQRLPPPKVRDELGRLVETFNQMISRLEASFAALTRFTADAAHELRGPLGTMRSSIDVVLARPREAAEYRDALVSIEEDVDRLRAITEALLVLARADAGRVSLERCPVRLDTLGTEVAESLGPAALQRGVSMHVHAGEPVLVLGDDLWLRQLAFNLLDNGVKFSTFAGHARAVSIEIEAIDGEARLTVSDSGPGIPEDALERIFQRFYRLNDARPYGDGFGLGLSITAWIVEAHGGTIVARNRPEGGASFSVSLPLAAG